MDEGLGAQRSQRLEVRVPATQERVTLDLVLDGLMPDRVVRIIAVSFLTKFDAVRIEDEIAPAMDPFPRDAPMSEQDAWRSQNIYMARLTDDAGAEYDDGGGATGLSADGQKTRGEYDFRAIGARSPCWVELVFSPIPSAQATALRSYTVRIDRE